MEKKKLTKGKGKDFWYIKDKEQHPEYMFLKRKESLSLRKTENPIQKGKASWRYKHNR